MNNINTAIRTLRTIKPGEMVCLTIRPEVAERLWFEEVSRNDRNDFELVVEPHGAEWCIVSVRLWSESGLIAVAKSRWFNYLLIAIFAIGIIGAICQIFTAGVIHV